MAFKVRDRNGRVLELDDGETVPDGYSIVVSHFMMDSSQRAVAGDNVDRETLNDMVAEALGLDGDDGADPEPTLTQEQIVDQAYQTMKKRLGTNKYSAQVPLHDGCVA